MFQFIWQYFSTDGPVKLRYLVCWRSALCCACSTLQGIDNCFHTNWQSQRICGHSVRWWT